MFSPNDDFMLGYGCCLIRNIINRDDKYNEERQKLALKITKEYTDYIDEKTAFVTLRDISDFKKQAERVNDSYPAVFDKIENILAKRYDDIKNKKAKVNQKRIEAPEIISPLCREMAFYSCGRHTYMPRAASSFIKTNINSIAESDKKKILEYIEPLRDRAYEESKKSGYYSLGIGPQYGNDDDYMSGVIVLLKEGRNDTVWIYEANCDGICVDGIIRQESMPSDEQLVNDFINRCAEGENVVSMTKLISPHGSLSDQEFEGLCDELEANDADTLIEELIKKGWKITEYHDHWISIFWSE